MNQDYVNILKKLSEFDYLKYISLDENQITLFKHLANPMINNIQEFSKYLNN
jgi:hypothetical protein